MGGSGICRPNIAKNRHKVISLDHFFRLIFGVVVMYHRMSLIALFALASFIEENLSSHLVY